MKSFSATYIFFLLGLICSYKSKPKVVNSGVILETKIIENMSTSLQLDDEHPVIDNIVYKTFVDKFNQKYKTLNESQKSLLKNYINNVSNTNSLREFVDVESSKIKKELNFRSKYSLINW